MGSADKKLILRVTAKLFGGFALLVVAYVFLQGLSDNHEPDKEQFLWLDISQMQSGEIQLLQYKQRPVLVLKQNEVEFTVAYAQDPVYGCPLQWQNNEFISICNGSRFSAKGKVYSDQSTDEDMDLLEHEVVDSNRLIISFD